MVVLLREGVANSSNSLNGPSRNQRFVCDGNLARSPAAEMISRHRAMTGGAWQFASCGVRAVRSDHVLVDVGVVLNELGVPTSGFRSRQATPQMLRDATLILTAGTAQNNWIVNEAPAVFRRVLLIKQAARLLADLPAGEDPLEFLERVRDRATPGDEIEDPYGRGAKAAQHAVAQVDKALTTVLPALGVV